MTAHKPEVWKKFATQECLIVTGWVQHFCYKSDDEYVCWTLVFPGDAPAICATSFEINAQDIFLPGNSSLQRIRFATKQRTKLTVSVSCLSVAVACLLFVLEFVDDDLTWESVKLTRF